MYYYTIYIYIYILYYIIIILYLYHIILYYIVLYYIILYYIIYVCIYIYILLKVNTYVAGSSSWCAAVRHGVSLRFHAHVGLLQWGLPLLPPCRHMSSRSSSGRNPCLDRSGWSLLHSSCLKSDPVPDRVTVEACSEEIHLDLVHGLAMLRSMQSFEWWNYNIYIYIYS